MARSINEIVLLGRLGADPELNVTKNGNSVANFTMATGESWKDKETGEIVEQTEWHRVTVYGKTADAIGKYVKKGDRIYIKGKNKTRTWEDDQGIKRYTTEIVVDVSGEVIFIEKPAKNNADTDASAGGSDDMPMTDKALPF